MLSYFTESEVEIAALEWFADLGYTVTPGADIAPGEPTAERTAFGEVLLGKKLREAIARLNPKVPADAQEEAYRKLLRTETASLVQNNRAFHKMLRDGVPVAYRRADGSTGHTEVQLVDYAHPENNDWMVVNQFTVVESKQNRRPDVVVFLNGLPLGLIELKNAADEEATLHTAFKQVQTYKAEIPSLLHYNAACVISDGLEARIGSLTANTEWFKVWRTIEGDKDAPKGTLELETMVRGVFEKRRFLDLLKHFVTFEDDADTGRITKILAGYHQFHAVNAALAETLRAAGAEDYPEAVEETAGRYWTGRQHDGKPGDRRAGVVWHTQGSGKSYSMLFYAARVIGHPAMKNPTVVVLTDRNDLDDQLFGQFQRCAELLRQTPVQADNRDRLRELLAVASGGVVFTTIQKFLPAKGERMPALSDRRNIVVVADEAHRSQYDLTDGFARNLRDALPNATFIGFTGTPIEKADANTRAIFGDYISIYDIQRAVQDKATVPIYYESRIAKLGLNASELPHLDEAVEEMTEQEEFEDREKLKSKWAALEMLVGDPKRVALIAKDLVEHYERRTEAMTGKAMVVGISRRVCVDIHEAILKLRPEWASAPDDNIEQERSKKCVVKVIMTGGADDGPEWQQHIRNKPKRRELANRFKDPKDPFSIVIVRDMWLTGFDAPCLHTMYADKPMRGHGLMQAIARVNRVFRDKPGGLVVDYLGIADQLKHALSTYTQSGGQGEPSIDTSRAIAALTEKHEVVCGILHGFNWDKWMAGTPAERLALIPAAQEHVLAKDNGKARFTQAVTDLSKAFALCAASDEAVALRDDVAFFQAVKSALGKSAGFGRQSPEDLEHAVRQLVSKAIVAGEGIIDVFTAAGLKKPDISILSDAFLNEVRGLKHKNVAAELLTKLLKQEIKLRSTHRLVQSRQFSEMLEKTLNAYHNRAISTQEVIEELIRLAKQVSEADKHGEALGLNHDEIAFYHALAANESAVLAMKDDGLKVIAAELVTQVRKSVTIDWTRRESARAKIKVMVKRILNKHGFPPDLQEDAVKTVLQQAELLCADWAEVVA